MRNGYNIRKILVSSCGKVRRQVIKIKGGLLLGVVFFSYFAGRERTLDCKYHRYK